MKGSAPHIVQYQGSKRKLAPQILPYLPIRFDRMIEPFAGMAAMTIAVACEGRTDNFIINDFNPDIICILQMAIEAPNVLIQAYSDVWHEQFSFKSGSESHYYYIRDKFNHGDRSAALMLYLLARCVKGSVRYNANGEFNQSPDKRRAGTNPGKLASNIKDISLLLKGKTSFYSKDFIEILKLAEPGDLVYLDPPYQGVSNVRDHRYIAGVDISTIAYALEDLNQRGIDYALSYDGKLGEKTYGTELPTSLGLTRINLDAGLSTQALFLGQKLTTYEALYLSPNLCDKIAEASMEVKQPQQYRLAL